MQAGNGPGEKRFEKKRFEKKGDGAPYASSSRVSCLPANPGGASVSVSSPPSQTDLPVGEAFYLPCRPIQPVGRGVVHPAGRY